MNILSIEVEGGFLKFGPMAILKRKARVIIIPCLVIMLLCASALLWVSYTKQLGIWASSVQWFVRLVAIAELVSMCCILFFGIKDKPAPIVVEEPKMIAEPMPIIAPIVTEDHKPYMPPKKPAVKKATPKKSTKK